jgi:hypothetical protein
MGNGVLSNLMDTALSTIVDVLPIALILAFFQLVILRRKPPHWGRVVAGFVYVLGGLTLFLVGLDIALFPIGRTMAQQLTAPEFIGGAFQRGVVVWSDFVWIYVFAALIGFATTVAEPSLIAVALKAEEISGGAVAALGLRIAVAIGVAVGVSLGAFRIVTGTPLPWYIIVGYVVVILQTMRADRRIIPLAYDSGGVTTSTVTVPVVAALGLGLASNIPGRSPLIDGFGLIAFASLFPMMSVMGYASLTRWLADRARRRASNPGDDELQGDDE